MMFKYIRREPDEKMLKHCFWDYRISLDDIQNYLNSDDWRLKKFLFEKIFQNSPTVLVDLMIFEKKDLLKLISEYKPSKFNFKFLNKRHLVVRRLIIGEDVKIPELEWRI